MEGYAASLAALGIAVVLGIASWFELGRFLLRRHIKLIFLAGIFIIFGLTGYAVARQYLLWLHDPLARFLLPPYQDISYFVFYSLTHFFLPYLISVVAALLLLIAAKVLNKKQEEKFFEKEEPYLAALSLFLVGHPGWLIYLVALILAYFILHTSYFILRREAARLPLYRLWAPTAFFVILLNEYWFGQTNWWQLLVI